MKKVIDFIKKDWFKILIIVTLLYIGSNIGSLSRTLDDGINVDVDLCDSNRSLRGSRINPQPSFCD